MPKGQASTHAVHESQTSALNRTADVVSSLYKALVGQETMQGARPHKRHT